MSVEILLFGVLPILPSLVGLLALIPAFLAGGILPFVLGHRPRANWDFESTERTPWCWTRFWLRQTPSVLVLVAIFSGARWAWTRGVPTETIDAVSFGVPSDDQWPMPRAGFQRHGRLPGRAAASGNQVRVRWRFQPPGTAFYGDAVPHGNRIYVAGSRQDSATIYALDRDTGKVAWSCRPPGYLATISSPTIVNDVLYIGEGLHHAQNARLVAVSLAGSDTGRVRWTHPVSGHLECSPSIVGNRVYFGAGDDGVYCLQLPEGEQTSPQQRWHVDGSQLPDVDLSVTVHEQRVYVGLGSPGNAMAVLDADTGHEIARWSTPHPVRGLPALTHDQIAYVSGQGDYVHLNQSDGVLYLRSLDDSGAAFATEVSLPATVLGAISQWRSDYVFGCADGTVYRYGRDGARLAAWPSGAPIAASAIVNDSIIVLHNRAGWLFGLEPESLQPRWRYRLGQPGNYVASAIAVGDDLVIGTDEDGLLCLTLTTSDPP